jgi:hypothetical protein
VSDVSNNHSPPNRARTDDVSRHVADGETTASPIADPKVSSTDERTAATMAPAKIDDQLKYGKLRCSPLLVAETEGAS